MIPSILNIYKFSGSRKGGENLESPLQVFYSFILFIYIYILLFLSFLNTCCIYFLQPVYYLQPYSMNEKTALINFNLVIQMSFSAYFPFHEFVIDIINVFLCIFIILDQTLIYKAPRERH